MSYNEVIKELSVCPDIIAIALGGSRSRGTYRIDSDYDLFCVIRDDNFESFRKSFCLFLEGIPGILLAAEAFYLENWGYLFKAIDTQNVNYDISIISKSRIREMGIRSTNIVIKDTKGFYQSYVDCAIDDAFLVSELETQHLYDYCTLFGFEKRRFYEAIEEEDYWYCVRCLERMKNYMIRCDRIQRRDFSKSCNCPERGYVDIDDCIKKEYFIDGTLGTLVQTAERLCELFSVIIHDREICMRSQLL